MPLSYNTTNQSYYISDNKSITFWIGGSTEESGDQTRIIKYIIRNHESNTWGTEGILFDFSTEFNQFINFNNYTDLLFRRINDNKIFVAVRPPADSGNSYSLSERVLYVFGTVTGSSISFSEPKILGNGDDIYVRHKSISALVVNDDIDPNDFIVLFSFISGNNFSVLKITESTEESAINESGGSVYGEASPYYTKLIKKNNLVLAICLKQYESTFVFNGKKPVVKSFNYNPSSKLLFETIPGHFYIPDIPIIAYPDNVISTSVDMFFTGEDYNFMIVGPDVTSGPIPA